MAKSRKEVTFNLFSQRNSEMCSMTNNTLKYITDVYKTINKNVLQQKRVVQLMRRNKIL